MTNIDFFESELKRCSHNGIDCEECNVMKGCVKLWDNAICDLPEYATNYKTLFKVCRKIVALQGRKS